jgi:hypothetical protein
MISSDQWINLPVGYNLYDHVGVSIHDQREEWNIIDRHPY